MKRFGKALAVALAVLIVAPLAQAQDRGKGGTPPELPTLKGRVGTYEPDVSITVEIKGRGGQVAKESITIVKDKTKIELGPGVKDIQPGLVVSVWAVKGNRTTAERILIEPEPPTLKGKVVAYEADKSITIETKVRNSDPTTTEYAIVKDKTRIEMPAGVKAIEVGMTASVWADMENPKNAAMIVPQASAPAKPGRGGSGAAPAPASAPKPEGPVDVNKVLEAYKSNLPTDKGLEWYTLDWVNSLGEAKQRAAKENRPILFIQTNKEGDLFCSLC